MDSWLRFANTRICITTTLYSEFYVFPQCMQYILNRIRSLNEFCVICDERHVLETGLIKVLCTFKPHSLINVYKHGVSHVCVQENYVYLLSKLLE